MAFYIFIFVHRFLSLIGTVDRGQGMSKQMHELSHSSNEINERYIFYLYMFPGNQESAQHHALSSMKRHMEFTGRQISEHNK